MPVQAYAFACSGCRFRYLLRPPQILGKQLIIRCRHCDTRLSIDQTLWESAIPFAPVAAVPPPRDFDRAPAEATRAFIVAAGLGGRQVRRKRSAAGLAVVICAAVLTLALSVAPPAAKREPLPDAPLEHAPLSHALAAPADAAPTQAGALLERSPAPKSVRIRSTPRHSDRPSKSDLGAPVVADLEAFSRAEVATEPPLEDLIAERKRALSICARLIRGGSEPGLAKKISFKLEIAPSGVVTRALALGAASSFAECATSQIAGWRFPSFDGPARELEFALLEVSAH